MRRIRPALPLARLLAAAVLIAVASAHLGDTPVDAPPAFAQARGLEVIGQLGGASGPSRAVATAGSRVYVGQGPRLVGYDVSDPTRPTPLGAGPILPGIVRHLSILGPDAVLAGAGSGLYALDITEPTTPRLLSSSTLDREVEGLAVVGRLAYATSGGTLSAWDFTDAALPRRIGSLTIDGYTVGVAVEGGFAYVTGWEQLHVVDVADPTKLVEVAVLDPSPDPFDDFLYVGARGDVVVLLGRDIHVIDVADPRHPVETGRYHPFQAPVNVEVQGDLVYLAISTFDEDTFGPDGGIEVVDISDPASPVGRGTLHVPDDVFGVAVADRHAYLAANGQGLRVVDVADPDDLREVASASSVFSTADATVVMDGVAFVAAGSQIVAYDARDTARSDPLGDIQGVVRQPFGPITGADGYLYLGTPTGLAVVDVRDPAHMTSIARVRLDDHLADLEAVGRHLYLANKEYFRVFDVADPTRPAEVGAVPVPENALGVDVAGQRAYVAAYALGGSTADGLAVLDVSEPTAPRRLGWLGIIGPDLMPFAFSDISAAGGYAYLGGAVVVDARQPTSPRRILQLEAPNARVGTAVAGNSLYVVSTNLSRNETCLRVLDVTVPARAHQTAAIGLADLGWTDLLAVAGDLLYVAAGDAGVYVIRDTGTPDEGAWPPYCAPQAAWEPQHVFLPVSVSRH